MNSMNGDSAFFDTNVLLYMYGGDPAKGVRAREVFKRYATSRRAILSTQVVQEFYASGSRKLGMPKGTARAAALELLRLPLVVVAPDHIAAAFEAEERYRISFWDALILAAAESSGADVLFSEDFSHGQRYGALLAKNPFRISEPPAV